VDYDWSGDDFLASFDKSGNVKWSTPGYYAQIATSDGGVIAQSYSGQSYRFDGSTPEFADQVAKSCWLPIQSVNHVFALTLTVQKSFHLPLPATTALSGSSSFVRLLLGKRSPSFVARRFSNQHILRSDHTTVNVTLKVNSAEAALSESLRPLQECCSFK
jgi:hypothetical protein